MTFFVSFILGFLLVSSSSEDIRNNEPQSDDARRPPQRGTLLVISISYIFLFLKEVDNNISLLYEAYVNINIGQW